MSGLGNSIMNFHFIDIQCNVMNINNLRNLVRVFSPRLFTTEVLDFQGLFLLSDTIPVTINSKYLVFSKHPINHI